MKKQSMLKEAPKDKHFRARTVAKTPQEKTIWRYVRSSFRLTWTEGWGTEQREECVNEAYVEAKLSRLSWKWRKRSSVKIAERTYEKRAQALHC
jgi:ribonuclease HII